jgi:UDP-glucuronate decarboxylase
MLELASLVLEMTGSPSTIEHRDLPADDPKQRQPNIEKAKKLLGWEPTIPLRDGLEKTIDYFRSQLG